MPCAGACERTDKNLGKSTRCLVLAAREGAGIACSSRRSGDDELRQSKAPKALSALVGPSLLAGRREDAPRGGRLSVRGSSPEQGRRQCRVSAGPVRVAGPGPGPGRVSGRWVLGGTAQSPFV